MSESGNTALFQSVALGGLSVTPFLGGRFHDTGLPFEDSFLWQNYYYLPFEVPHVAFTSAIIMLVVVALCGWLLLRGAGENSARRWLFDLLALFLLFLNLNMLNRDFFPVLSRQTVSDNIVVFGFLGAAGLFLLVRYFAFWRKALQVGLVILSPLALIAVMNSLLAIQVLMPEGGSPFSYDMSLAEEQEGRKPGQPRIIWIIFDELDQNLTYDDRPEGIDLPAFDAMRATSFMATTARAPANMTEKSLPALTIGEDITADDLLPNEKIRIHFGEGRDTVYWDDTDSLFRERHAAGSNIEIISQGGPPYCRLFGQFTVNCMEQGIRWGGKDFDLVDGTFRVLNLAFSYLPGAPVLAVDERSPRRRDKAGIPTPRIDRYLAVKEAAGKALAGSRADMVFLHLFIPHSPFFYDRHSDSFAGNAFAEFNPPDGYLHNLVLADKTLAELRDRMEEAGEWDDSVIIISSDHWCREGFCDALTFLDRKEDARIPFIVKLPGQTRPYEHPGEVHTVNTRALIDAILAGEVSGPQDIPAIMRGQ